MFRFITLSASLVASANAVGAAYTSVGAGACRGNGGGTDKVNHRSKNNVATEASCETECDALATCAGFAYQSAGDKECILYGPDMSGSCAAPNADQTTSGPSACTAIGNCNNPSTATSETSCGTCSVGDAVRSDSCASINGVWTAGTWTTTGVWEEPEGGWTGDFFHTDHVHAVSPNANYVCYDKDIGDHVGRCANSADTPSTVDCAATFEGAATFEAASCSEAAPENCVYRAAPTAPAEKPPHPTAATVSGYTPKSGACRSTSASNKADSSAAQGQDRPPYAYKKNTAFPTFPDGTSPTALATLCDATPGCLGFHSGPWMSLFGDETLVECGQEGTTCPLGDGWAGSAGQEGTTTLETTKPNHQYICYIKDPAGLSTAALIGIIAGGVVAAILVLLIVYKCAKKKPSAKTSNGASS